MHCTQNYLRFAISGFPKGALNSAEGLSWPENVKCGCGSTSVPSLPLNSGFSKFCIAPGWGLQRPTLQVWPPTSLPPLPVCTPHTLHLREVLVPLLRWLSSCIPFLPPKHKGFCGGPALYGGFENRETIYRDLPLCGSWSYAYSLCSGILG